MLGVTQIRGHAASQALLPTPHHYDSFALLLFHSDDFSVLASLYPRYALSALDYFIFCKRTSKYHDGGIWTEISTLLIFTGGHIK